MKKVAAGLHVSPTPVREALARLVGEGLVVITGDHAGFAARRVGYGGYLSLLDAFAALLGMLARGRRRRDEPSELIDDASRDPAVTTNALVEIAIAGSTNEAAAWLIQMVARVLAPYQAAETAILPGWREQLTRLGAAVGNGNPEHALREYVRARRAVAAQIVDLTERGTPASFSKIRRI